MQKFIYWAYGLDAPLDPPLQWRRRPVGSAIVFASRCAMFVASVATVDLLADAAVRIANFYVHDFCGEFVVLGQVARLGCGG